MLLKHLLEIPTRVTGGVSRHLLRGANGNDLTALVAALRTKIYHPIRATDHIEVVLDHKDGIALSTSRCITSINLCTKIDEAGCVITQIDQFGFSPKAP